MNDAPRLHAAGRLAAAFVSSKLTPLFVVASILLGVFAGVKLPREEEPQIIVPMIDVFIEMPGASAREVEERVTKPMEKLLWKSLASSTSTRHPAPARQWPWSAFWSAKTKRTPSCD